jgi:hypothetical protein
MSLETKRKIFFAVVGVVFFVLFALVFLPPCMAWADELTLAGVMVFGIFPYSQFQLTASATLMGVLVIILFNVDTKVLIPKSEPRSESKKEKE